MLKLVSGKNNEGYQHALAYCFDEKSLKIPTKSALSQFRKRISFRFFRDALIKLIQQIDQNRILFRGYRIYATDGFEAVLPRTKDVLDYEFVGKAVGSYRETYYPRMYISHCYDVLSKTTKDVEISAENQELKNALKMIKNLEEKSITLYDRLYPSYALVAAHEGAGNCFIARASRSSFKEAVALLDSSETKRQIEINGTKLWVIKIKNSRTQEWSLFITNLPEYWVTEKTITHLYGLRWEVETSFKEWVDTLKLEQWHSKSINGILQEFYASLWLYNYSKFQILLNTPQHDTEPLKAEYKKPNFKLIFDHIVSKLKEIINKKTKQLRERIVQLQKMSLEKRKRRSRSYPRQLRGSQSPYPYNNQVWDPRIRGGLN